jgi:outer membrane protein OmpA-like peptidoglycan-associated protein/flagellar hook assembly protein FlgD
VHRAILAFAFPLLAILAIAGCASKPKTPAPAQEPESSSVQAEATGLAPSGDLRFQTIDFALLFGSREAVESWSLFVSDAKQKTAVWAISGDSANLPDKVTWDGRKDSGSLAAEGMYIATLAVEYGERFKSGKASSKQFALDITPPSPSFAPNPAQFAYAPAGIPAPISIALSARPGFAKIVGWGIEVFNEAGDQIKDFTGTWPAARVEWDGKTDSGDYVSTAKSYPAVLAVTDEYGNKGTFKGSFSVADIPGAQSSSISPRRGGFSPTSASVKNSLDLLLAVGSRPSIAAWRVDILSVEKGSAKTVRSFSGASAEVPEYVRWDGKDDSGNPAAQGSYYASLSVDYGKAFKPAVAKSKNFSLVTTPPSGSITVDPPAANLNELGPKKPVNFTVQAKSSFAQISNWILGVYDESKVSIVVFNGNWPNNKIAWDGKTVEGGRLIPGSRYSIAAKVQDEYGNVGDLEGSLLIEGLNAATEPTTIEARSAGFAPTGDGSNPAMEFALSFGDSSAAKSWKVEMIRDNIVERSMAGTGAKIPPKVTWDGKTDNGSYAPEGSYSAMLSVDYGTAFAPVSVETRPFVLDLTPPSGSIGLSTGLFSPDGDGENDTVTIATTGSSALARIASWSLTVYDPGNNAFAAWKGAWPAAQLTWDGKAKSGDLVESASDYTLVLKLRDEFGNVGAAKAVLPTDILVMKVGDGYRIRVSSIVFKPFTADYTNVQADRAARNAATLDLLASKLARFPDYRIRLEGHAVMINWDNDAKGEAEQREVLLPLSNARAEAIKAALVEKGISADRMVTEGVGAKDPVVPDSDYPNRWKNRRVEFYILK